MDKIFFAVGFFHQSCPTNSKQTTKGTYKKHKDEKKRSSTMPGYRMWRSQLLLLWLPHFKCSFLPACVKRTPPAGRRRRCALRALQEKGTHKMWQLLWFSRPMVVWGTEQQLITWLTLVVRRWLLASKVSARGVQRTYVTFLLLQISFPGITGLCRPPLSLSTLA